MVGRTGSAGFHKKWDPPNAARNSEKRKAWMGWCPKVKKIYLFFNPKPRSLALSLSLFMALDWRRLFWFLWCRLREPLLKLCSEYHREREREKSSSRNDYFFRYLDRIDECGQSMIMACATAGLPQGLPSHLREYYVILSCRCSRNF